MNSERYTDLWLALGDDHTAQLIHYEKVEVTGSATEELLEKREDRAHRLRSVFQCHGYVTQHDHDVLRYHLVLQLFVILAENTICFVVYINKNKK